MAKISAEDSLNVTSRSRALQDVIWSTAVQHGPNNSIVHRALDSVRHDSAVDLAAADFDQKLIHAIYAERGRKDAQGNLVHFAHNSPAVQQGVARRLVEEEQDALAMLGPA